MDNNNIENNTQPSVVTQSTDEYVEMESNNKKGGSALIVILVLIILCLGGFIVYDKVINKEEPTKNTTESKDKEVVQTTNSFKVFADNFKANYPSFGKNTEAGYVGCVRPSYITMISSGYEVCINKNHELSITYFGSDYSKYSIDKLTDHVLNAFIVHIGNGSANELVIIYDDGTVGTANTEIELDKGITLRINDTLKNIIYITDEVTGAYGSSTGPLAIDINGNVFKLNN